MEEARNKDINQLKKARETVDQVFLLKEIMQIAFRISSSSRCVTLQFFVSSFLFKLAAVRRLYF